MNGNLKTQSEFYGDDQIYSGAGGSSTNMYVVEDVYDFLAVTGDSTYYELVSDIDFNDHDTYSRGVSGFLIGSMRGAGPYLFGNGHKIRNLLIKNISDGSCVFCVQRIQDVVFENMILMDVVYAYMFAQVYGSECTLDNVHIGCYVFNSDTYALFNEFSSSVPLKFSRCSFNLSGRSKSGFCAGGSFEGCHINTDLLIVDESSYNSAITFRSGTSFVESYFTGRIRFLGGLSGSPETVYAIKGGTIEHSYFAVSIPSVPSGSSTLCGCAEMTVSEVSFIDKNLIPNMEEVAVDNLYYLTTEQATDPDYLISIGFPVVPI